MNRIFQRLFQLFPSALGPLAVVVLLVVTVGPGEYLYAPVGLVVSSAVLLLLAFGSIPRGRWQAFFQKHYGWLPAVIGVLTLPYWIWYWDEDVQVNLDFFSVSAQVLPVLALAMLIDVQRSATLSSSQIVTPLAILMLGEIACLDAVARSSADATVFGVVAAAFTTGTVALVMASLADSD